MTKELSKKALIRASDEYIKLWDYVVSLPNGALIEYSKVQEELSIQMTSENRNKLRRAIVESERAYKVIPTIGYKLAGGEDANLIVDNRINRVGNSVRRLVHTQVSVKVNVWDEMSPEDKKVFNYKYSVSMALNESIQNTQRLKDASKPRQLSEGKPVIPDEI